MRLKLLLLLPEVDIYILDGFNCALIVGLANIQYNEDFFWLQENCAADE
jgi:hypothetical protein